MPHKDGRALRTLSCTRHRLKYGRKHPARSLHQDRLFRAATFNAMLSGLIYGTLLYRRPVSIKRIVIAEFFVKLVINCGLNTLWISMLYGKGFIALLGPRVIKNVIMLPIDSFILFFALTYAKKIAAQFGFFTVKSGAKERA